MQAKQISFWSLGLRTLWRDWRAGELYLLVLAVTLAVTALCAVGFFADRLQQGFTRDAAQLLGGDVVIASDQPAPAEVLERARQAGLQINQSLSFPTMARALQERGGNTRLIALKAVETGYPLRGQVRVSTGQGQPDRVLPASESVPASGQAWVDAALLDALELQVGDALELGEVRFRITQILSVEPDRGAGFMNFAPRVMINQADMAATQLVQPASRVNYRLAAIGSPEQVRSYADWAQQAIKEARWHGVRLETLESGRPEMRQTLERAEKFLNLVALLATLLSAVAVALAARSFALARLDDCAMLRVLGLSQSTITRTYLVEFLWAALGASTVGVLLGYAVHGIFMLLLGSLLQVDLPQPSYVPAVWGMILGVSLLLSFGLPPLLQLAQVPALRVIRRDLGDIRASSWGMWILGVFGLGVLLLGVSQDRTLGLIVIAGFACALVVFGLCAWAALKLLRWGVNEATAPRWLVLATRQVCSRPVSVVVQVSALSVGLLALALLVLLRTDLIRSWQQATPPDAPNRFVINIQPDQGAEFEHQLQQAGVTRYDWYPMIRGRLVAINGKPVSPDDYQQDRAKRLVDREFNLSNTPTLPSHNTLVAGRWSAGEAETVSVEEGIAKTLGLRMDDVLSFDIAGDVSQARITSLRKVEWGSMRANFFVIYPVQTLPEVPFTYLAAFRNPESAGLDNQLQRQFPNITNVNTATTLRQIQSVLSQVISAIEYLFAFTLLAGVLVLLACLMGTREERARELAIMRALGATSSLLSQIQRAELLGVGLLAGLLASVAATAVGWALAFYVFEFTWAISPMIVLAAPLCGALVALGAGWWSLRSVVKRPVAQTLRQAAQ